MRRRELVLDKDSGDLPEELALRAHPIWRDPRAVARRFPEYLPQSELRRRRPSLLYAAVLRGWALAHGFEDRKFRGSPDWHALRAAGLGSHDTRKKGE